MNEDKPWDSAVGEQRQIELVFDQTFNWLSAQKSGNPSRIKLPS